MKKLIEMEENVLHRYHLQFNSDYPIIEKILPSYETKWDFYKNDKMNIRNRVNYKYYYWNDIFLVNKHFCHWRNADYSAKQNVKTER